MNIPELLDTDLSVNPRALQLSVTQQGLDKPNIGTTFQHQGLAELSKWQR